jgi:type II secretion system protein C
MALARFDDNAKPRAPRWLRASSRRLPAIATTVLVVLVAYQLAELTWSVVPAPGPASGLADAPRVESAAESASPPPSSVATLPSEHLFGEAQDTSAGAAPEPELEAPETTLRLKLTGILLAKNGPPSAAIIASERGAEQSYATGDTIDDAGGATLHAVYEDRVVRDRAGTLETLRPPKETAASNAPSGAPLPLERPVAGDGGDAAASGVRQGVSAVRPREEESAPAESAPESERNATPEQTEQGSEGSPPEAPSEPDSR